MSKTWKVLVSAPYFQPLIERFRGRLEHAGCELVLPEVKERLEEHHLLELVGDIDGAICGDDRYTARVIAAAPRLKVISKWGTGVDSFDAAAAAERGIAICRTPGAFTEPVADSTLGYMLCFARQLPWMSQEVKSGVWSKRPGKTLAECTLGIIGVGDIGRAVARRARAFGMPVLGNDIVAIDPDFLAETGVRSVGLGELLAEADFVALHCDLNPTSRHLINETTLSRMKPGAVLLNLARGPVVDERALERALADGRLGGAALDVYEDEPLPTTSPLRDMDNVLLAAHNANNSPRAWERVHENTISNLLRELRARS